MKQRILVTLVVILWCLAFISTPLYAATTGKVAGKVTDKETGEPLPGANVTIVDSRYGAAADADGDFFILNVPPGVYACFPYSPIASSDSSTRA